VGGVWGEGAVDFAEPVEDVLAYGLVSEEDAFVIQTLFLLLREGGGGRGEGFGGVAGPPSCGQRQEQAEAEGRGVGGIIGEGPHRGGSVFRGRGGSRRRGPFCEEGDKGLANALLSEQVKVAVVVRISFDEGGGALGCTFYAVVGASGLKLGQVKDFSAIGFA